MRRETLPSVLPLKTLRLSPLDRKVTDVPRVEGRKNGEGKRSWPRRRALLRTTIDPQEALREEISLRLSESQDCPTRHILTSFLGRIDDSSFRAKCKFPMPSLPSLKDLSSPLCLSLFEQTDALWLTAARRRERRRGMSAATVTAFLLLPRGRRRRRHQRRLFDRSRSCSSSVRSSGLN